jgi:hypothetical protein
VLLVVVRQVAVLRVAVLRVAVLRVVVLRVVVLRVAPASSRWASTQPGFSRLGSSEPAA